MRGGYQICHFDQSGEISSFKIFTRRTSMLKQSCLSTRFAHKRSLLLLSLLIFIYLLENSTISLYIDSFIFNYIIKPALWISISFIVWCFPRIRSKSKLKHKSLLYFWAFNFATIYVIITIMTGLIYALGKSPYDHSIRGIIINIIFVGSALIGRELIRDYLVHSYTKNENYLVFISIALLMTITNLPISKFLQLDSLQSTVKFIAEFFAPEFAHNIFATYLVFIGGPLTSIIYFGVIQGFQWLSPTLPDLKWITTALVGILCPVFFLMSLQTIYLNTTRQIKKREQDKESPMSWAITSIISILIIWFAVGVFPIYPSVIATGSMEPMIKPGDVILVKRVSNMDDINALKVGDVIQFKRDSILISHRIIEIVNDEKEGLHFETKGDNNSAVDSDPVKPQDIKGPIVYTVPKVGWPTLLIKSDKDIDLDKIHF